MHFFVSDFIMKFLLFHDKPIWRLSSNSFVGHSYFCPMKILRPIKCNHLYISFVRNARFYILYVS
jgi:hypothetical protein